MRREGGDVTIVGVLKMAQVAERAATQLAHEHGVEAEVIDPRTLRPLDLDTILESVRKTNRAVIVEEGWPHGGVGANLATLITEQAFDHLDAPVQRVTGADVPMPYSRRLEQAAMPHEEHVVKAALAALGGVALMADVVMPRLSDSMEEGTILQWLKQVGRRGRRRRGAGGDRDGQGEHGLRVRRWRDADRDRRRRRARPCRSGSVIARIGDSDEGSDRSTAGPDADAGGPAGGGRASVLGPPASTPPAEESVRAKPPQPQPHKPQPSEPALRSAQASGRVKASPLAKRLAKERGLDLGKLDGLGAWRADRQGGRGEGGFCRGWRRRGARPRGSSSYRRRWGSPAATGPAAGAVSPETAKGQDHLRGPHQAAVDHCPADGGVEGDRAALLPGGRDRHERRGRGASADQGDGRRGRGRPLLQRHGRQGRRPGAARVSRGPTAPTATGASSSTRGSTSGSPSPGRTRWSSRPSSTPTARGCGRSPRSRGRWRNGSATARSPRRSSPAPPSPSPTWGCTGSTASRR